MQTDTTIWTNPWLRPFNDVAAIDDLLAQLHPTWSLGRIKARVLEVAAETPDTKTFVLRANRNWPGFRPGQHVGVEVEIGGVRHQRRYSLSAAPAVDRVVAITVKRQPGGTVSNWLHDRLQIGDALTLAPPAGSFALPEPLPAGLLMLSAGSGITPLMSMLRTLVRAAAPLDLDFVHVTRRAQDAIFAAELAEPGSGALRVQTASSLLAAEWTLRPVGARALGPGLQRARYPAVRTDDLHDDVP